MWYLKKPLTCQKILIVGQTDCRGNELTSFWGGNWWTQFLLGTCGVGGEVGTRQVKNSSIFSISVKEKLRLDLYLFCHFQVVSTHCWLTELKKTGLEQPVRGHLAHAPTPRQEALWLSHSWQVSSFPTGSQNPLEMEIAEAPQATSSNASLPLPLQSFTLCLVCTYLGAM